MRYSYSFISRYQQCSMNWYFRYRLKPEIPEDLRPNNPLNLGILLEDLIQNKENAVDTYYNKYPVINNLHVHEVIKAKYYASQIQNHLSSKGEFEYKLRYEDFIGYIDYVERLDDGTYRIYDFKYSNHVDSYTESMQLHLYKYYFELATQNEVSEIAYIMAPKPYIKKEFEDSEENFRKHLTSEMKKYKIKIVEVEFDENKVDSFLKTKYDLESGDGKVERNIGRHCGYCDYARLCINTNK